MASNSEKPWLTLQFHDVDQQNIKKPDELLVDKKNYDPPSPIANDILNRILGSIFGMAIGDALGAHVEFRPYSYLAANPVKDLQGGGTWGLEKGQFTDDTSMALCLANSLILHRDFVPYDQLVRYKWWYRHGYMSSTGHCFDIGAATRQSIQEFERRQKRFAQERGVPESQIDFMNDRDLLQHFDVYCSAEGVAGNGALMRLAPVPLFFYRDPKQAVEFSGISGQITHGDKKAYDACRYYGALIVAAVQGINKTELMDDQFYDKHKDWFGDEPLHQDIMAIARGSYKKSGGHADGIRGKGYIVDALEAALWAFWSDGDSFHTGALSAVNLGDDTDTTAAIYGQLAGACYGHNKLPPDWLAAVYASKFLECISHWIGYEGEQWHKHQTDSNTLVNSYPGDLNKTISYLTLTKRESGSKTGNSSISMHSLTQNPTAAIERRAVNTSGCVGSFYDAFHDHIIKSSTSNCKPHTMDQVIKCTVKRGDDTECQNLLRFIGYDDELRLSLISNMARPEGIALVTEYPYLIDGRTRILYYSCMTRIDFPPDSFNELENDIHNRKSKKKLTHVITKVQNGIDVIAILRLSSDDSTTDDALKEISQCLSNDVKPSKNISLNNISFTRIYSNIPALASQNSVMNLLYKINDIRHATHDHMPYSYTLLPIQMFYTEVDQNSAVFQPLKQIFARKLEEYLLPFSSINKMWKTTIDDEKFKQFYSHVREKLHDAQKQINKLNDLYIKEKERLQNCIEILRYASSQSMSENDVLNQPLEKTLKDSIDEIIYTLTSIRQKIDFLSDLHTQGITYHSATNYGITQGDDENIIQNKLLQGNRNQRILCSNDSLNINNWSKLGDLFSKMLEEKTTNPQLQLVYADFTSCSYKLDDMKTYPSIGYVKDSSGYKSRSQTKRGSTDIHPHVDDQTVNILLLGRSGVGKSTLINTFNNYLKCNSYKDVNSPRSLFHIIIPFMQFIGGDFGEHVAMHGVFDSNEDFDHPDQSVTQQCKSYNFNKDNQKICIIDTPGFGKSHSATNNDDITMQHILSRVTNLTHLNAVCVVLDSDNERVDDYHTCLTYLFQCLGEDAYKNIVFCFTKELSRKNNSNERDDLIKVMIQTLLTQNIVFNDTTTFIFDSAYFTDSPMSRQLMPRSASVNKRLEESWNISKKGWDRLLNHIRTLRRYPIQQDSQKASNTQLEINQLVRPVMEMIRNNMKNLILHQLGFHYSWIELNPKPVRGSFTKCYSCRRVLSQCGGFWMVSDSPHVYRDPCYDCSCSSNDHIKIDYTIEYQYNQDPKKCCAPDILIFPEELLGLIANLANFIMSVNRNTNNDPFLSYLNRMIDEERSICINVAAHAKNAALHRQLVLFKRDYQQVIETMKQKNLANDIDIYDVIEQVKQIPSVKKQIDAANQMPQAFA